MSIFLILSVIGIVGFVVIRQRSKSDGRPKKAKAKGNPHAAVSIVYDDAIACPEVKEFSGKRILGKEAPKLPLPNCSARSCSCSFHQFSDRRKGPRRADETGVMEAPYIGQDRRESTSGRRANDTVGESTQDGLQSDDAEADTYYGHHAKTGTFRTKEIG